MALPTKTSFELILDLPAPFEPFLMDTRKSLEEQLPPGAYRDAARKMLDEKNKLPFDFR